MQHEQDLAPPHDLPRPQGFRAYLDGAVLRICARLLDRRVKGRLRLTLPSGRSRVVGSGGGVTANLTLKNYRLFPSALRRGSIGFAESYLRGDAETRDLGNLFRLFLDNKSELRTAGGGWFKVRRHDRKFHRQRRNTISGSRRNIAEHYDLGNAFYAAWLDSSMTYSSARFSPDAQSLTAAQDYKNQRLLAALELQPGHRVLEIGCGWGGLIEAAARRGAEVTGITVSSEQFEHATKRLVATGLAERAQVRFEDYRKVQGTYDRIASVEMIEAVGEDNWPIYFRTLADRLAPGGVAVLQAISIAEAHYPAYRAKADFIQRYIFPGGMLPTVPIMTTEARAAGLSFETIDVFGPDYARTLAEWRDRFHTAWPQIEALGFDDRFRRMWDYYLLYCQIGFESGMIDVGHYRLRKSAIGVQ